MTTVSSPQPPPQPVTNGPAQKKPKLEHEAGATPAASTSTTPAPAPSPAPVATAATGTSAYPSWGTPHLAIDPALQQQSQQAQQHPALQYPHYQTYTSPYQAYYQYHTQTPQATTPAPVTAAARPQQTPQPQQPQPQAQPQQPLQQQPQQQQYHQQPAPQTSQTQSGVDTTDVATLNDALGSAGVDLRAEEETLQRTQDYHQAYRLQEDRSRKQDAKLQFDTRIIGSTMREIGTRHKVPKIPDECVNYLALALRFRLEDLIRAMIAAAAHRTEAQYERAPGIYEDGTPMWGVVVKRDVRKQMELLERLEREEEMRVRRERKERAEAAAALAEGSAQAGAGTAGTDGAGGEEAMAVDGAAPKKSKKKKDGPGVTARNMSEDVQKRLSNAVATQAAGLGRGKYAWMTSGSGSAPAPKPKPAASATPAPASQATSAAGAAQSTWAKPYVSTTAKTNQQAAVQEDSRRTITIRDGMFVVERERGHGGGRGAARGWS